MPRIKLIVEYDGTDYVGWQIQPNGMSVQSRLTGALESFLGHSVKLFAVARTDSGVHALGQVVVFDTERELPTKAYWRGLNGFLPSDIAVVSAEQVDRAFGPRRWCEGKRYRYLISNRRTRSPIRRRTHWEVFAPLDVAAMARGARALVGEHDFSAFRAADCQARHAIRKMRRIEVEGAAGQDIFIEVEGTAFLKHMVRNFVGTLVEVGKGKRPAEAVADILASKKRALAGVTAPAHGLTLVEVFFGTGPRSAIVPGSDDSDDEE